MDADLTTGVQLLNGLIAQLSKNEPLTVAFSRHACSALLSRPLFYASGHSATQQHALLAQSCAKLLDAVSRAVTKGSLTEQSTAAHILTACIQTCDSVSLLERAVGWGTQLTEAIRRAAAAAAAAAAVNANDAATEAPAAPPPAAAVDLIQAACTAAAVLFTRAQQHIELPGVRREIATIVPKLLPQLLPLLQSQQLPSSCQTAVLVLLAAVLHCVPSTLRSTAAAAERAVQQLTVQAASTADSSTPSAAIAAAQQVLAQAAVCAALLPAVQGDASSWSEAARKLMSSCHDVLDHLLLGLESRPVDPQYRAYLAPAAGAAGNQQQQQQQNAAAAAAVVAGGWLPSVPWQQQQQQQQQQGTAASKRQTVPAKLLLGFCISALQQLVQQPFPVPVPAPGYCLALLAARLLQFDAGAAVAAGAVAGSSTMYQELLVLQPQLQQAGWQLLQLVDKAAGQQLQLQGLLLRLARQGLRSVQLSGPAVLQLRPVGVRCCIYATATQLLQRTGLAGVRALASEVMGCTVLEMYGSTAVAAPGGSSGGKSAQQQQQQRPAKRAKTSGGASGHEFEQFDPASSVAAVASAADAASRMAAATAADLAPQATVLQLLQQLLESGGQLLPAEVRSHADAVAFHAAQTAAAAALKLQQQPALSNEAFGGSSSGLAAVQVAAYQAMLASILVPCNHRAPFLSQALLLLRQGRSSSNPALAAVCKAAAVQCEALLHPRATAMGSVRQYTGMDSVPPLTKPRMWSAVDAALGQAGLQAAAGSAAGAGAANGPAAAAGAVGVSSAAGGQQQQAGAGAAGNSAAAAAGGGGFAPAGSFGPGAVVVGYPVNLPNQQQQQQQQESILQTSMQQQQQQQQQGMLLPKEVLKPDAGATQAAAAAPSVLSSGAQTLQQQLQQPSPAQQQQQALAPQHPAINPTNGPVGSSITAVAAAAAAAAATAQPSGPGNATGPGASAAGIGGGAGGYSLLASGLNPSPAAAFDAESSDSEGPLPDIDSGSDSEDGTE